MTMPRTLSAEILDGLSEDDPAAIRSRRDLRRVHRVMGTRRIIVRALLGCGAACGEAARWRVLELGAGDGTLMLGIARAMQGKWPAVDLTLLDRLNLVGAVTIADYATAGWTARSAVADALDWAASDVDPLMEGGASSAWDLIIANLFLHHFEGARLAALLRAIARRSGRFFACEPRRGWLALGASHLIGAIGAGAVTRTDAVLSVRAGFRGREITALWPADAPRSTLIEYAAGLFSHCFYAERCRDANSL